MIALGRFMVRPVRSPVVPLPGPAPGKPAPVVEPVVPPKEDKEKEMMKEAPLVGVDVHVDLIDFCAQIKQTQRFRNKEESPLEATFEFELPKGCAVSSFSADIGDRHLNGTVKEKETAENEYDDALAAGHSAVLMENKDEDPNTFCVQLGNIAPGAEAFVIVTYELLAAMEEDKLVLTLDGSDANSIVFADPPMNTPENDARVQPGFNFAVSVSTKSALKSVSSPSHPINVELQQGGAVVRLAEGADWKQNKNFVLEATVEDPHQPSVRIQKFNGVNVAMTSFYPRIETPQTKCEMIFVLDRSGSMSGSAIECAKSTLQFFLRSLPEDAFFNIFSFGSTFERFRSDSVPFNDENLEAATAHVSGFRANLGGTNIYEPLDTIFKQSIRPGYPRQVFILTDGEVNNKDNCINLVRSNAHTTRLFSFGIGLSVDKDLVNGMARAGQGSSSIVRDTSTIRQSVMKQLERALQPGLTGIQVMWNNSSTGKLVAGLRQSPINPPPIFRGTRLVSFALLPADCPPCKIVLTGSFGDSEYTSEVEFDPSKAESVPGEQIVKLGVRSMIEDLQNGLGGIPLDKIEEIKKAVIDLSVKFGILSKFTAFVAVGSGGETLEASMITKRVMRREHHFLGGGAMYCAAPMMNCAMGAAPAPMMKCSAPRAERKEEKGHFHLHFGARKKFRPARGCAAPAPAACASRAYAPPPQPCAPPQPCVPPAPCAPCAPPPAGSAPSAKKGLDGVILQQKASGCFNVNALAMLDIPDSALLSVPKEVPAEVDEKLAKDIWVTLLVLAGLKKKYSDKLSEWSFIAKKSEKWAQSKLGTSYDLWKVAAEALLS